MGDGSCAPVNVAPPSPERPSLCPEKFFSQPLEPSISGSRVAKYTERELMPLNYDDVKDLFCYSDSDLSDQEIGNDDEKLANASDVGPDFENKTLSKNAGGNARDTSNPGPDHDDGNKGNNPQEGMRKDVDLRNRPKDDDLFAPSDDEEEGIMSSSDGSFIAQAAKLGGVDRMTSLFDTDKEGD